MAIKTGPEAWEKREKLILIEGWRRDGLTEEQCAHNMGIALNTLRTWKKKSELIDAALKTGKEVADREVENALFKSACGYSYEESVKERKLNPDTGRYEMVTTKITQKVVPPSPVAQFFWLKNRKPEVWRDKREIESNDALDRLDMILGEMRTKAMPQESLVPEQEIPGFEPKEKYQKPGKGGKRLRHGTKDTDTEVLED